MVRQLTLLFGPPISSFTWPSRLLFRRCDVGAVHFIRSSASLTVHQHLLSFHFQKTKNKRNIYFKARTRSAPHLFSEREAKERGQAGEVVWKGRKIGTSKCVLNIRTVTKLWDFASPRYAPSAAHRIRWKGVCMERLELFILWGAKSLNEGQTCRVDVQGTIFMET